MTVTQYVIIFSIIWHILKQISKFLTSFYLFLGSSRQTPKTCLSASQTTNYRLSGFLPRRDFFHSKVKKVHLETIDERTSNYLFPIIILLAIKDCDNYKQSRYMSSWQLCGFKFSLMVSFIKEFQMMIECVSFSILPAFSNCFALILRNQNRLTVQEGWILQSTQWWPI